jgi:NitT/TauT family transport system ATP-binding protein
MSNLIRFADVEKKFDTAAGGVVAVKNINLTVERGEIVTLVGPSGCGKSTLLNMTAGLFSATSGQVTYAGSEISGLNPKVGYMTQSDHLLPWRTVRGNIAAPLQIARFSRSHIAAKVEELVSLVGLGGFIDSYPSELSGGMRKRAALARLLAYDPETLLMDEPFGALDAQLRLRLQKELRTLCKEFKKTVIFVTHDLDEAVALGDRVVVFSERPGTIIESMNVPLPENRDLFRLRFDNNFTSTCAHLWTLMAPSLMTES